MKKLTVEQIREDLRRKENKDYFKLGNIEEWHTDEVSYDRSEYSDDLPDLPEGWDWELEDEEIIIFCQSKDLLNK